MIWSDFIGNQPAVEELRRLVREQRARRTVVLAGPEGVGKTTLALMLGWALNGAEEEAFSRPADALPALIEAALEYREAEVRGNPREAAPLVVAPHPAVRLYPPDGDFLTMAQARAVIHQSQLQPDAGATWTLIVPEFDRARWTTQAALLKTLEEPPPQVSLVLLARNPLALLPTVRSRALVLTLSPVATEELARALRKNGMGTEEAGLVARLAQGCPGRALRLDLAAYRQARHEALEFLAAGLAGVGSGGRALSVFRLSESTRTGKEKFETLLEILYSVLQDIVYLQSGFSEAVRNVDCLPELTQAAQRLTPARLAGAVEELDRVQSAAGRNVFRPLALESWALGLASPVEPAGR